jgi:tight adherence protein B
VEPVTVTIVAALVAATGVALFAYGLASLARWRFLDRRIREYVAMAPASGPPRRARRPVAWSAALLGRSLQRRLTGSSYEALVQERLNRAGLSRRPSEVVAMQGAAALVLALAGAVAGPPAPAARLLGAALLAGVGAALPLLWLNVLAGRRAQAFERQLPQAIEAMAATLQAGSTLQQAVAILARDTPPPMGVELRRVLREAELGLSFSDSLAGLAVRIPSPELVIFTSAVSIQQRVGGDLARILRVIGHTIRERLRIRGETRVLTAQARYSAYIVAGLPVCLFAFLWVTNYQYLSGLFQPGITRMLAGGAVVGMVLGFYSMQRIAAVDV